MAQMQVSFIEQDIESVKKAFDVLSVWYSFDRDTVLAAMNRNPLAVENAPVWESGLSTKVKTFDDWDFPVEYYVDDIINYLGTLYRVVQSHTSQKTWMPPDVASLYTLYRPIGTVTVWKQPISSVDAYNKLERVTHVDKTWESVIDANTWEPGTVNETIWLEVIN